MADSTSPSIAPTYGLKWVKRFSYGYDPQWSIEPDHSAIEVIARKTFSIPPDVDISVTFFKEGALNKLYKVNVGEASYIIRVALPVDPAKTLSEVTTMRLIRDKTSIPIPRVLSYDATSHNELRLSWVSMEIVPGRRLSEDWRKMPMVAKRAMTEQLAGYQAQLLTLGFHTIGSVVPIKEAEDHHHTVLTCVILPFAFAYAVIAVLIHRIILLYTGFDYITTHNLGRPTTPLHLLGANAGLPLGPYLSTRDWLSQRLAVLQARTEQSLHFYRTAKLASGLSAKDLESLEDNSVLCEGDLGIISLLIQHLPRVFPRHRSERTMLFHHNLSERNIMVDSDGVITAILDWEHVCAVPFWYGTQFPGVLMSMKQKLRPRRSEFGPAESFYLDDPEEHGDLDGVSLLYWESRERFEKTILRKVYMAEMDRLVPGWAAEYKRSKGQREFEDCIAHLEWGGHYGLKGFEDWLEAYDPVTGEGSPEACEDRWPIFGEGLDFYTDGIEYDTDDEEDDEGYDSDVTAVMYEREERE